MTGRREPSRFVKWAARVLRTTTDKIESWERLIITAFVVSLVVLLARKAGLLEVADVFVVNKADRPGADDVRRDLDLMLDLSHLTGQDDTEGRDGYRPPIVMCSALEGTGEADVWAAVVDHLTLLDESGRRQARRHHRIRTEVRARMAQTLGSRVEEAMNSEMGRELVAMVEDGALSPTAASAKLLDHLLGER